MSRHETASANLCLIEVDGAPSQAMAIKWQAPAAGSRVFAVSNALGLGVGISEGVVSGVRHFPNGDYIQFTAPISPGSEGGALVDDDGQLLGIVDYRRRDGQNVNFASLAEWIDQIEKRSAENAEEFAALRSGHGAAETREMGGAGSLVGRLAPAPAEPGRCLAIFGRGRSRTRECRRRIVGMERALPRQPERRGGGDRSGPGLAGER